jgi:phytoene dehydrogenase-like protein
VHGLREHGGKLLLNSPVTSILEGANGSARGVVLKSGAHITAKKAVVSNASLWDTQKLIPQQAQRPDFAQQVGPSWGTVRHEE